MLPPTAISQILLLVVLGMRNAIYGPAGNSLIQILQMEKYRGRKTCGFIPGIS